VFAYYLSTSWKVMRPSSRSTGRSYGPERDRLRKSARETKPSGKPLPPALSPLPSWERLWSPYCPACAAQYDDSQPACQRSEATGVQDRVAGPFPHFPETGCS
jgi:hypothetical protein